MFIGKEDERIAFGRVWWVLRKTAKVMDGTSGVTLVIVYTIKVRVNSVKRSCFVHTA